MIKNTGKGHSNYGTIQKHDDEIRMYHAEGWTRHAIGRKIGFDPSSVVLYCEKIGLEFKHSKVTDHIDEIIDLREEGYSVRKIADLFGFTHPTVSSLLKKYNVNTDRTTINFDQDFFEKIDTQDKAYCLGLMMSDGYVQHGRVAITMCDLDVIEKFRTAVKYEGKIRKLDREEEHHKDKYELNLYSTKMYNDIKKYGILPNKSLTLRFPKLELIPTNLLHHLVRGIHDGDGCLMYDKCNKKWNVVFTGTLEVLQGVEISCEILGRYYRLELNKNTWHWKIRTQGDVVRMLEWMYKDATIYMDRKKATAERCLVDMQGRSDWSA